MKVKTASLIAAIGCCVLVVLAIIIFITRVKTLTLYHAFEDLSDVPMLVYPFLQIVGFALLSVFFFTLYKKIDYEK